MLSSEDLSDAAGQAPQHLILGVDDGYVVMLGLGDGRLAEALVQVSRCDVIAVEPDAEKVAELQTRLSELGVREAGGVWEGRVAPRVRVDRAVRELLERGHRAGVIPTLVRPEFVGGPVDGERRA